LIISKFEVLILISRETVKSVYLRLMIQNIRVTKQFDFETAHALDGYTGKCQDIHGHSYHLQITVIGKPIVDKAESANGMVIDFGEIKRIVNDKIIVLFDHRLILRNDSRFNGIEANNMRVRYVKYQPTCENMLIEIVDVLKQQFGIGVELHSIMLRETANSFAEWYAKDN
jgi:6-pyruvoyltetrahydropterin/6-carboxytetrahydropterin synthase